MVEQRHNAPLNLQARLVKAQGADNLTNSAQVLLGEAAVRSEIAPDLEEILRTKRVIVIANYTPLAPLFVASTFPERESLYSVWVDPPQELTGLGGVVGEHILPIKDPPIAHAQENGATIGRALKALRGGAAVVSFPDRGDRKFQWGVGRLSEEFLENDAQDTYIVFAHVQEEGEASILDLRRGAFSGQRTVRFHNGGTLETLLKDVSLPENTVDSPRAKAEAIAAKFQAEYVRWEQGLPL